MEIPRGSGLWPYCSGLRDLCTVSKYKHVYTSLNNSLLHDEVYFGVVPQQELRPVDMPWRFHQAASWTLQLACGSGDRGAG